MALRSMSPRFIGIMISSMMLPACGSVPSMPATPHQNTFSTTQFLGAACAPAVATNVIQSNALLPFSYLGGAQGGLMGGLGIAANAYTGILASPFGIGGIAMPLNAGAIGSALPWGTDTALAFGLAGDSLALAPALLLQRSFLTGFSGIGPMGGIGAIGSGIPFMGPNAGRFINPALSPGFGGPAGHPQMGQPPPMQQPIQQPTDEQHSIQQPVDNPQAIQQPADNQQPSPQQTSSDDKSTNPDSNPSPDLSKAVAASDDVSN